LGIIHLGKGEEGAMNGMGHYAPAGASYEALDLRRTSDFQAALLGMAGHDLRQPLQIIQSAYEWLGSRVAHTSEKARLQRGERAIARLTEQLDRLVSALRLYEHTQRMDMSAVALAPLFRRIANENESDARENAIELRIHATRSAIMSNAVLLEGILRNLVRNAVKYTEPGGRILIGCRRVEEEMRIDVYDTGVGIAPEHLPQIFDAFQRVDSTCADGLGIGLFVVRRAVQLLAHRVEVRSAIGRGSRFSVFARVAF
jgi:two-component system, OmpR family, phosphate regulon sensor histidine kinase PhoR